MEIPLLSLVLSLPRAWAPSLVGELKSDKPRGKVRKKKGKHLLLQLLTPHPLCIEHLLFAKCFTHVTPNLYSPREQGLLFPFYKFY